MWKDEEDEEVHRPEPQFRQIFLGQILEYVIERELLSNKLTGEKERRKNAS